jgi:hypothetical protein
MRVYHPTDEEEEEDDGPEPGCVLFAAAFLVFTLGCAALYHAMTH